MGLYRGTDAHGEPCTMEVRSRPEFPTNIAAVVTEGEANKDPMDPQVYGVIVTGMPWADILQITPLRMEGDLEKLNEKDYGGYRGDLQTEAELVRLALDDKLDPTSFVYFNNVDATDKTQPIVVECRDLVYAPHPSPEEVTVDDFNK